MSNDGGARTTGEMAASIEEVVINLITMTE